MEVATAAETAEVMVAETAEVMVVATVVATAEVMVVATVVEEMAAVATVVVAQSTAYRCPQQFLAQSSQAQRNSTAVARPHSRGAHRVQPRLRSIKISAQYL